MSEENSSGHPRTRGARSFLNDDVPVRHGSVLSFDGHPVFFSVEGPNEPLKPTLVFCYGIACSTLHWTYQIDYFRKNYRCVWMDYRGHCNTKLPNDLSSMTVEASARDLRAVLNFLEIEKSILLGHSMGVSVVLEYTRLFPEDVMAIVLANGTPKRPLETLFGGNFLIPAFSALSFLEKQKPEFVYKVWKLQQKTKMIGNWLGALGFNRALTNPGDIRTYARQIADLHPAVLTRMMDDYQHYDATPWLHEIKQPTLIISGEKDLITPPDTQKLLHQLIPNSELVTIQHGSHCSTLDLPEYVNLLIERFISKL
ncbi:MAG: alpha/beta hydrolase [Bdellovibrionales bacterium]|nr:alpha/beta hydrolase [Bdellovibrionales bacterium]